MKLIIKQYLASLKERDELDVIFPDLLSQLGLNVFSRPKKGTRQDGVDVGAVGCLGDEEEKVYLVSIKAGNLGRSDWDGSSVQSLRQSLNEIKDVYISNRLPVEHKGKPIVICIGLGGDVLEQVRPSLEGYIQQNSTDDISFVEWNGDKLASLIETSFLREDLLPDHARSDLRKSLALLDEPEASFRHFSNLIRALSSNIDNDTPKLTPIRQMSICLWIIFSWARGEGNLEAAYLAGELTLMRGWDIARAYLDGKTKVAKDVTASFLSIHDTYNLICSEFLRENVLPHAGKLHALSSAVHGSNQIDVNLKLFDLLGRVAIDGIWAYWVACAAGEGEDREAATKEATQLRESLKLIINNNPALLLPLKDDQEIDVSLALFLVSLQEGHQVFASSWLTEMMNRAEFSFQTFGKYPCILNSYSDLLVHPKPADEEYREKVTEATLLYATIALWASVVGDDQLFKKVAEFQQNHLEHSNFQLWYPDETSEEVMYSNSGVHGATLSHVPLDKSPQDLLDRVFGECDESTFFEELSAIKSGWWPIILVACRHYRLPLPPHFWRGERKGMDGHPA